MADESDRNVAKRKELEGSYTRRPWNPDRPASHMIIECLVAFAQAVAYVNCDTPLSHGLGRWPVRSLKRKFHWSSKKIQFRVQIDPYTSERSISALPEQNRGLKHSVWDLSGGLPHWGLPYPPSPRGERALIGIGTVPARAPPSR